MFLTICYPGPKVAGKNAGFMLSNFYYDNDRKERFKRPISPQNIDRSIMGNGLNVAQTRHANDMAGAGACLLSKIKQKHPEILKEGNEIVYLYPGGGLGSGVISVDKDNIKVKPTEIQHIKKHGNENLSLEQSVGAHAIVSNFVDALNLKEDVRDKFASNVKAVCSYEEANRIHPISEPNYEISSAIAIDSYMNSLAELIATQVCALKAHDVVLTGPIAHGIRDSYNKTPGFSTWATNSDKTDDKFTQALRAKVHDSLTTVGKAILGESDNLNIYFINLVDNTDGAQILQKCDEVGEPTAWYNMHE